MSRSDTLTRLVQSFKPAKASNTSPDNASPDHAEKTKAGQLHRHIEPPPPATDPAALRAIIEGRRSVRRFTERELPQAVLDDIIDLALLAPNSSNLQPWEFVIVRKPALRKQLAEACTSQNAALTAPVLIVVLSHIDRWKDSADQIIREWPMPAVPKLVSQYYQKLIPFHFATGPLDIAGRGKQLMQTVISPFKPVPKLHHSEADLRIWAAKSTALACENIMLAARAHGFDSCPMEGFDERRVKALVGAGKGAFVNMVIALGERADNGIYQPRQRFPRAQMVREL